jgi:hypothetical protein
MTAEVFRRSGNTNWNTRRHPTEGEGNADFLAPASSRANSFRVQSDHVYTGICGGKLCDSNSSGLELMLLTCCDLTPSMLERAIYL